MAIQEFLSSLTDLQLLSLKKYKSDEYLPENKRLIDQEIERRGLDMDQISDLIKNHTYPENSIVAICTRCFSERTERIEAEDSYSYHMLVFEIRHENHDYHYHCQICGNRFIPNR